MYLVYLSPLHGALLEEDCIFLIFISQHQAQRWHRVEAKKKKKMNTQNLDTENRNKGTRTPEFRNLESNTDDCCYGVELCPQKDMLTS